MSKRFVNRISHSWCKRDEDRIAECLKKSFKAIENILKFKSVGETWTIGTALNHFGVVRTNFDQFDHESQLLSQNWWNMGSVALKMTIVQQFRHALTHHDPKTDLIWCEALSVSLYYKGAVSIIVKWFWVIYWKRRSWGCKMSIVISAIYVWFLFVMFNYKRFARLDSISKNYIFIFII